MAGSPGPAALSTETHFPAFILPENLKTRLHPEGPGSKSGDTNLRVSRASDDFHRSVPDCGARGTGVEQSRVPAPPPLPSPTLAPSTHAGLLVAAHPPDPLCERGIPFASSFFFFLPKCVFCECAKAVTFRGGRPELRLWLPAALPLVREMKDARATCERRGLRAPPLSCHRADEFPQGRRGLVSLLSPCAGRCQPLQQPSAPLPRVLSPSLPPLPAGCSWRDLVPAAVAGGSGAAGPSGWAELGMMLAQRVPSFP